jgi:hypothetical protein
MAIKPTCDKCIQELVDYGGLLFSPPDNDRKVTKYHLCKKCFAEIEKTLNIKTDNNIKQND